MYINLSVPNYKTKLNTQDYIIIIIIITTYCCVFLTIHRSNSFQKSIDYKL